MEQKTRTPEEILRNFQEEYWNTASIQNKKTVEYMPDGVIISAIKAYHAQFQPADIKVNEPTNRNNKINMNYRQVFCKDRLPKKEGIYITDILVRSKFEKDEWWSIIDGNYYFYPQWWLEEITEPSLEEMIAKLPVGEYYINNPIKNGDMWCIQITGRTFEGSTLTEAVQKYFNHLQSKKA